MKKLFCVLLTVASTFCLLLGIVACKAPKDDTSAEPSIIQNITSEVVDEGLKIIITTEDGANWSFTVPNGRNGRDGSTPYIGENGHWWVGSADLGVPAQGAPGSVGQDGKSAYELYRSTFGYGGTEEQWLSDLVAGRLKNSTEEIYDYIPENNIIATIGEDVSLPNEVTAYLVSGSVISVRVEWNSLPSSRFVGYKPIKGYVKGYPNAVICNVKVVPYNSSEKYIDGFVNGILPNDETTVVVYNNDSFMETCVPAYNGYFKVIVPADGYYTVKVEAAGYNAVDAESVEIRSATSKETQYKNIKHINFNITALRDSGYFFVWTRTETGVNYEVISRIDTRPEIEFLDENIATISDMGAAPLLRDRFHIVLNNAQERWTNEYSSRFYQLYSTFPESVTKDLNSVWTLSNDSMKNDIEYYEVGEVYYVTVSKAALANVTPRRVTLDGVAGEYFSNRFYNALLRFVTDGGQKSTACETILEQNFCTSFNVPDYRELTKETTQEGREAFEEFNAEEKLAILTMFEEMPEGMHKMPELKYLVRRKSGTSHPLYPSAAAVTWTKAQNPYIEFMDPTFISEQGYYNTKRLIIHEKTHMYYEYYFSDELKEKWNEVGGWYENPSEQDGWSTTKQTEFVSAYAHAHNPDEDMAESVAAYITDPALLKSRSIEKYNFIRNYIMQGDVYELQFREDLTFEVYNLDPDYIYPGQIKQIMLDVKGDAFEDKTVTTTLTLNGTAPKEGANRFFYRCTSANGKNYYDTWGHAVDDTLLTLQSTEVFSKDSYNGYWYTDQIILRDDAGNERYEGSADYNYKLYIDNPLMDDEAPEYVKGSLKLSLEKADDAEHPNAQTLKVEYSFRENRWLEYALIRLVCIGDGKDSIDLYAKDQDINQVHHTVTHYVYIPEHYSSGDYEIREISLTDRAKNNQYFMFYDNAENNRIRITTTNPDYKGPELNLKDISVSAIPANPAHPDGETYVTLKLKIKDNISGLRIANVRFADPQGIMHFYWLYTDWYGTYEHYFEAGDPTVEREYSFTVTLPKGSAPGTWAIYEITLTDFAMNNSVYNFAEIVHFSVSK